MQNNPKWAMAGCKSQTRLVLSEIAKYNLKPQFVVTMRSAGLEDNQAMADLCEQLSIPLFYSENLSEYKKELAQLDLLLVCRFNLLKESVFSLPKLGSINIHNALLPDYPGVHPVSWAILQGKEELGVTVHKIDKGIDSGAILLQQSVEYQDFMSVNLVNSMLDELAAHLIVKLMLNYVLTDNLPIETDNQSHDQVFYARRRTPEDSRLSELNSNELIRANKALPVPYPQPFCHSQGQDITVLASSETALEYNASFDSTQVVKVLSECVYLLNTKPLQCVITTDKPLKLGTCLL